MPKKAENPFSQSPKRDQKDYPIGYGKPPEATRFKPGASGNPKGRPKGARNKRPALNEERLKEIILNEAYRKIKVNDGARTVSIPMVQAVVRSLAHNAAKGQSRAAQLFTEMVSVTEAANRALHNDYLQTAIQYKVDWGKEIERRRELGVTGPYPLPHADDIVIDFGTGDVRIKGPMTNEEKVEWDKLINLLADTEKKIEALESMLQTSRRGKSREVLESDLAHLRELRETLLSGLSDSTYFKRNRKSRKESVT